jgi:serine/threonine protein kinase/tetratricopeptide (TPR) repeat protein
MGIVFAAFDRERGQEVALKVLRLLDADGILLIKREFRSLAEVSHPNLVSLYELVSAGRDWFFTMEFVEGLDFRSWVWRHTGAHPAQPPTPRASRLAADEIRTPAQAPTLSAQEDLAGVPATPPPVRNEAMAKTHDLWRGVGAHAAGNVARLRTVLRQLAQGIDCIHAAGKVHCDIKPTNVLVTPEGRLVLLDFGLVRPGVGPASADRGPIGMSGTPEYMSPEQALGEPCTPASDWYAVGAMLYEVLVGRLPFSGDMGTLLFRKTSSDPPDARAMVPEEVRDLADLSMRLLAREPDQRPATAEVLRALGTIERRGLIASSMTSEENGNFVGRVAQLDTLHDALRDSHRADRTVVMLVRGRSGIGKSALCRRFLDEVRRSHADAVTLAARCYERESVPHKALDGVVDALVDELAGWDAPARRAVLPDEHEALVRLFPALRRLWQGHPADHAPADAGVVEPRALLRRALTGLRRLLVGIAKRRKLVVHVDDLQWGDLAGAQMLADLISHTGDLPSLWILSYRKEDEDGSEAVDAVKSALDKGDSDVRRIDVEPLAREDCRALVVRLLGRHGPEARQRAEVIAQEAEGSPIFASELVRFELGQTGARALDPNQPTTLEQLLRARVLSLPEPARRLLARVAVAGRPVRQRVLRRAVKESAAIFTLRNANLVRASGVGDDDTVETYHDRIRELIISVLSPTEMRQSHADLADALTMEMNEGFFSPSDLEAIAYHSLSANDAGLALEYSLRAARQARGLFASRDAVRHFETALSLMRSLAGPNASHAAIVSSQLHEVEIEAAETCRQAGFYERAIELLTSALAATIDDQRRAEIYVRRGHVYQEKSDTQAAIRDLETALALCGRPSPRSHWRLVVSSVVEIVRYAVSQRFASLTSTRRDDLPEAFAIEHQADVLFLLMRIYYFVDRNKLLWSGFTAMNLAQRSHRQITQSLAGGYFGVLLLGVGLSRRAALHCERALRRAVSCGSRMAEGTALGRLGTVALFENELDSATEILHRSVATLRDASETWELLTSQMLEATSCFLAGRLASAERHWSEMAVLARDVGGTMHLAWALAWLPYVRHLRGAITTAEAVRELENARALSGTVGDVANQIAAMGHLTTVWIGEGNGRSAARAALRLYRALSRYGVQVPFLHIGHADAAEAALLALRTFPHGKRTRALSHVLRRSLRQMAKVARSYPYLRAPMLRVEALAAAQFGKTARARKLIARAIALLEQSPNRLWLSAACRDGATILTERRDELLRRARQLDDETGLRFSGSDGWAAACA